MSLTEPASAAERIRATWAAAHAAVPSVPRWARTAALAVPFTVLPSSLWRIAVCTFHAPIAPTSLDAANSSSGIPGLPLAVYVILLSIVSELLAFTAVGLVAGWGEVFPRWLPLLRGRTVPALGAAVLGAGGATVLTLLWTWTAVSFALGRRVDGSRATGPTVLGVGDWQGWVAVLAYAPLLLWGPLLGAVTIAYWKRRRAGPASLAEEGSRGGRFRSPSTRRGGSAEALRQRGDESDERPAVLRR